MTETVQKRVLVVEDEPIIALATKTSLERFGYAVSTVCSGEAAIETARSAPVLDLVLMDIDLGDGMDGTEAAAAILSERLVPVVFLSSHTEPEVVARTEKITSYGYVVKNSNSTVLDASIKMALKLFDAHNRLRESEKRFQDLFENMNDAFALHDVLFDAAGNAVDYRFIEVNSEFATRLGMAQEQIVGHTALELFPATEQSWIDAFGRVATTGVAEQLAEYSVELDRYFETRLYSPQPGFCAGLFSDVTERKRIENENRVLADVIRRSSDFIGLANLETNAFFVNPTGREMVGLEGEEAVGQTSILDYFMPEDREFVEKTILPTARETGRWAGEFRFRHFQTHRPIPVYYDLFMTEDPATGRVTNLTTITRSLSTRDLAERELRQFRTMTDNAVFGCAIATVDGTVRYVNAAFAAVHGYEPAELVGRHLSIFHTKEQLQQVLEANEILKATGTASITEIGHLHRDGTEFPMLMGGITLNNEQGDPELLVVSAIDISERKRFEQALLESEAQFRDFFESAPDAVFIADIEIGRILKANSAAVALTGHAVAELIGMHQSNLHPPAQQDYSRESFSHHAGLPTERSFTAHIESEVMRADGTTVPVDVAASQVMYEGRRCLMGIFRDMSEQREAERRIQALVGEKENLLKEVQHRVKNVMSTMGAMLSLQAASTKEPAVSSALSDAATRFRSIELLYDHLYRDDTHSSGSLTAYLSRLVEGVVGFFGSIPGLEVELECADIYLPDKTLSSIGLIVNELITNAMKYAFFQQANGRLSVRAELLNGQVTVSVQDNGPGLPADFDARTSGGFGLNMVQAFAEQLRGAVVFEQDCGVTVKVVFPQDELKPV